MEQRQADFLHRLLDAPGPSGYESLPARIWREEAAGFADSVDHDILGNSYARIGTPGKPVSRQAVSKRSLLALRTGNGRVYYPAFQFANGRPIAGLADILAVIEENLVSRWTLASWLVSPEDDLDGASPIDALSAGEVQRVLEVAQAWALSLQ